jgi:predicted phosphodiesterase
VAQRIRRAPTLSGCLSGADGAPSRREDVLEGAAMTVRLAVVADIHHGPPHATKRGDAALPLLGEFARFVADARPDAVLDLGDCITDVDAAADRRRTAEVADAFRAIPAPLIGVDGNHDRDNLSAEETASLLARPAGSETLDLGGWRLAIWRADPRIHRTAAARGFALPEPDFLWLAAVVATADRPLLVVSHAPVSGRGQTGNYYFENNPDLAGYPEAPRVRTLLQRARVPVVCLAGHVHWNTATTVDGVVHLTQQSLTESFTTGGEPSGAMGLLELGDDGIAWTVTGRDPIDVRLSVAAPAWVPSMPRFELPARDTARGPER